MCPLIGGQGRNQRIDLCFSIVEAGGDAQGAIVGDAADRDLMLLAQVGYNLIRILACQRKG